MRGTRRHGVRWVAWLALLAGAGCAGVVETGVVETGAGRGQYSLRVADAALASGAPEMGLRVAEMILAREPGNVDALVARGDALYALGRTTEARAVYRGAVARDAGAAASVGLGRTVVRGDPRAAEAAFREALRREPGNVIALNNLGLTQDLLGRHGEAQDSYRRALAIAPEMADVQVNLGLSMALSGQAVAAARMMAPLVEHASATALWRHDVAVAMTIAGDPAGARLALDGIAPAGTSEGGVAPRPVTVGPVAQVLPAPVASVERVALAVAVVASPVVISPVVISPVVANPVVASVAVADAGSPPTANVPAPRARSAGPGAVQLGSLDHEAAARRLWRQLAIRLPDLLDAKTPSIRRAEVQGRTFWRLRTGGFASRTEATSFCQALKSEGQGCWVL